MDYYVDNTAFVTPMFNWAIAPYEPKRTVPKALIGRTEFSTEKANSVDFFRIVTGPLAPTAAPREQEETAAVMTTSTIESTVKSKASAAPAHSNVDVERIAKQRVQLMAAKYASGVESSEILARLEILNARLLDRAPRVSKDQVLALENANEQLLRIRAARAERSKRLGIPA